MNRLLKRQLKKLGLNDSSPPSDSDWQALLDLISQSYSDSDKDRQRLEHSIEVNSEEMYELNVQLKAKVKDKGEELDQAKVQYRMIIESLADGVLTVNKNGIVESFNEAAELLFDYKKNEVIGNNVSMLMPEDDRVSHQSYIQETRIEGSSSIFHRFRELLGMKKDGSYFPIEINVTPFGEDKDKFVGIIRDITERRKYENALLKAKEEAESGSRAKSKFLASMSHELRTPLNAILGFAELFEYSPELTEQLKQNAKEIQNAGNHLLQLINEVLDMSRIESGNVELSTEPILVKDLLSECVKLSDSLAAQKSVSITIECPEQATLEGDYTKVKQVLLNLISNSIKYNKINGKVECNCLELDENYLLIEISDTGNGIEESNLELLFKPFNRLGKENSSIEGTGLGLTITKKLVQYMDGEIGVESDLGVGSRFWVKLPKVKSQLIHNNDLKPKLEQNLDGKPVILYIEDNPANQRFVSQISQYDNKYNFVFADDAESGIKKAIEIKPQLILMDIDLPGMDGCEALQRIKKMDSIKQIPVVAITANSDLLESKQHKDKEFSLILAKPISVSELLRSISDVIKQVLKQGIQGLATNDNKK